MHKQRKKLTLKWPLSHHHNGRNLILLFPFPLQYYKTDWQVIFHFIQAHTFTFAFKMIEKILILLIYISCCSSSEVRDVSAKVHFRGRGIFNGISFPKWDRSVVTKHHDQKQESKFWPPVQKESRCKYDKVITILS